MTGGQILGGRFSQFPEGSLDFANSLRGIVPRFGQFLEGAPKTLLKYFYSALPIYSNILVNSIGNDQPKVGEK